MKIGEVIIKIALEVSRVLLGVTFIFSGFVKADDPYGFAYKIQDYFLAFGLPSLSFLALPISFCLCASEFLMGAFMLFGIYRKWTSRFILLTMLFMTPLTLYLALANPVQDCGCFGDAWIITNWQTFYKNIVLLAGAVLIFIYHEKIWNLFTGKTYWLAFFYIILFICGFLIRNYMYEPLFDFRPYKIGTNIAEAMKIDEGKGRHEVSYMIYAKDGKEERFTDQNSPWEDSTWVFVRVENELISEGEAPLIKDFTINKLIFDQQKNILETQLDITHDVLSDSGYVFLMISPSLTSMNISYLSQLEDVYDYAYDRKYAFYCLTATGAEEIVSWAKTNTINFDFCNTDDRTLKTITRSNPGLLLLKNGIIINKWADREVPSEENLTAPIEDLAFGQKIDSEKDKKNLIYIILIFILPLLTLKVLDFSLFRKPEEMKDPKAQKETN